MRVIEVHIQNIGSISEITLKPGTLNVIEGNNAVGKTSILRWRSSASSKGGIPPT
jgi:predicted ATP-dependent endonuclease of OLD family